MLWCNFGYKGNVRLKMKLVIGAWVLVFLLFLGLAAQTALEPRVGSLEVLSTQDKATFNVVEGWFVSYNATQTHWAGSDIFQTATTSKAQTATAIRPTATTVPINFFPLVSPTVEITTEVCYGTINTDALNVRSSPNGTYQFTTYRNERYRILTPNAKSLNAGSLVNNIWWIQLEMGRSFQTWVARQYVSIECFYE